MKVKLVESLDSNGNELSPAQDTFFKRSKVRNSFGDLLVVYRGTVSQNERNYFSGNAKWFTANKDYADKYVLSNKDTVYSCYLNCNNIFDCGNTDGRVFKLNPVQLSLTDDFKAILAKLDLTEQLFVTKFKQELQDRSSYAWHIYTIVRTDKFIDIVRRSGYDCIHTIEEGNNDCYGVLYDRCIKLTSNENPTNSDKINESLTEAKQDIDNFKNKFGEKTYDDFINAKDRLKNNKISTDITYHVKNTSPEEMSELIQSLYQKDTDKQKLRQIKGEDKEIRGKYKYLGEKEGYKIYQPLDYIASMDLGVNTGWCTTGRYGHYGHPEYTPSEKDAESHWNDYTQRGIKFYYFLDAETMYGKWAIAVYSDGKELEDLVGSYVPDKYVYLVDCNCEIYNDKDELDYSQSDKLIDILNVLVVNDVYCWIENYEGTFLAIEGQFIAVDKEHIKTADLSEVDPYSLRDEAFADCKQLESIIFPDYFYDAGTLPNTICYGCNSLKEVKINNDVYSAIGFYAFTDCHDLKKIVIPESINQIKEGAFKNCFDLKDVVILNKDNFSFGSDVFDGCDLVRVFSDNSDVEKYCKSNGIKHFPLSSIKESLTEENTHNEITVYRVDHSSDVYKRSNGRSRGMFFTDDLDYFENSATGYDAKDAKEYTLDLNCKVWDPITELDLQADTLSTIWGEKGVFDKNNIMYEYPDSEEDFEEDDDMVYTDTDYLAQAGYENGYDVTVLKDIPSDGGWGPEFTEYVVYNLKYLHGDNVIETLREDVERMSADFKPEKVGKAYKVFYEKDGKLYPPMVANKGGADTPIGVWLKAQVADMGKPSKTGRPQVQGGGKGTKSGKLSLAFRPGWHLGDIPLAKQFLKKDGTWPKDLVWAECDYAMDVDYQDEANERGYWRTKVDDEGNVSEYRSDKYQHSLAGLKKIPENGYYKYRTNPNPDTVPWVITGAMKVNRILSNDEVEEILKKAGIQAPKIEEQLDETLRRVTKDILVTYNTKDVIDRLKENEHDWRLLYDDHEKMWLMGDASDIIHFDLLKAAWDNGYYDDQMDFITTNIGSDYYSYRESGEDGFYINEGEEDEEWVDPWIYSLIYATPDSDNIEYYRTDGFEYDKKTSLGGTMFARDNDALEYIRLVWQINE